MTTREIITLLYAATDDLLEDTTPAVYLVHVGRKRWIESAVRAPSLAAAVAWARERGERKKFTPRVVLDVDGQAVITGKQIVDLAAPPTEPQETQP